MVFLFLAWLMSIYFRHDEPSQNENRDPRQGTFLNRWFGVLVAVDSRSLGIFRIGLGCLLLFDLFRRIPDWGIWYSAHGLIPSTSEASLLRLSDDPVSSQLFIFTSIACYVAFTLGWRTRLFHLLSFVSVVSLHNRVTILENGGDVVLGIVTGLSLLLPLGLTFSIDSVRQKAAVPAPIRSIAVALLLFQLFVIYFLNGIQKNGPSWRSGGALELVLAQSRIVTTFGDWWLAHARASLPLLTYISIGIEIFAPFLLLSPWHSSRCRLVGLVCLALLHIGIGLAVNVGLFSAAMIVFLTLFIPAEFWDRIFFSAHSVTDGPGTVYVRRPLVEALSLVSGLAIVIQVSIQNPILPEEIHMSHSPFTRAIIDIPRFYQGWMMFAPDAPREDGTQICRAITASGRAFDPLNRAAIGYEGPPFEMLPRRLGYDQFWCDYFARIKQTSELHDPLRSWISSSDGTQSFEVSWISGGENQPSHAWMKSQ